MSQHFRRSASVLPSGDPCRGIQGRPQLTWRSAANPRPGTQIGGYPHRAEPSQESKDMFLGLAVVLLVLWLIGFLAFHAASGLIHLLIILAVISFVVHFVRGRSTV
jgi:hypothetical protein